MMRKKNTVELSREGQNNVRVMESAVAAWERNGWTRVDDGSSETDSGQDETVNQTENQFSVKEEETD